jgi:hypothetical protein
LVLLGMEVGDAAVGIAVAKVTAVKAVGEAD